MSLDLLREKLADVKGLTKVNDAAADRHVIEQFTASLNFVVWFMLFIAAMMDCFIVANFTMTYVQRKTRELTIMRINGFSIRECTLYCAVDLVVTTILGTILGLALGSFLGNAILRTTETPYIQMIREPAAQTYIYSALITGGFSALTNSFALRRIKKLKLSDIS
jgi:putative ABC transport system permease protein